MDLRRRLPFEGSPTDALRRLRDEPGLVALVGAWAGGGAVIASRPLRVVPQEQAPWDVLDHPGDGTASDHVGGGWFGALGYGLARRLEALPAPGERPVPLPEHSWAFHDAVMRLRPDGTWWAEWLPGTAPERVERLVTGAVAALAAPQERRPFTVGPVTATPSGAAHRRAVERAVEHVREGDVFQANVCLRLDAHLDGDSLDLFCAGVEALAPAHAAFVRLPGGGALASLSPELFWRRRGREVVASPIKGTAPRTGTREQQDAARARLAASAKDRAENVMIVDLMRNDLSRVSAPGTVAVPALTRVEPHAGVWHLVSDVRALLRPGTTDGDVLRATFPPGSVTGAPKVRALEVIAEVEATAREHYTGAIGFTSPTWGAELNVAIRTFEARGDRVWLGVGGGITAGSDPAAELEECWTKARPLLAAVGAALPGEAPGEEVPVVTGTADPAAGVFATLAVRDGVPLDLPAHLERLTASAAALYGAEPGDVAARARRCAADAARAVCPGGARLRLLVRPRAGQGVEVSATTSPWAPLDAPVRLLPVVVTGGLGAHKWADRARLAAAASLRGVDPASPTDDVLLLDADGAVLETGRYNLFAVLDGVLVTPPADGRLRPGTARAAVLALAARLGVPTREGRLALADLAGASEVVVTNALHGVRCVGEVSGTGAWAAGPVTARLRAALAAHPR